MLRISNAVGQQLTSETVQVRSNNMLHVINIGTAVAGTYYVTITNQAGVKTTLPIMVK
jgi:hypothetical protein